MSPFSATVFRIRLLLLAVALALGLMGAHADKKDQLAKTHLSNSTRPLSRKASEATPKSKGPEILAAQPANAT